MTHKPLFEVRMQCFVAQAVAETCSQCDSGGEAAAHRDVPAAAIALDVLQALDIERVEAPQIALDGVLLHLVAYGRQLLL